MTAVVIRGTPYPVLLPKLRDPRLHLAATITSLQVIGQVGFHFRLSIAQILVSLGTCFVLETGIAFFRRRVILWPASALLTGNGVAFVLRVPGTQHGDWWSLRGWWIFAATAAVSLLSKHVIAWRGEHVFNPSNFGLVVCFLALGRTRADPLDFWWGPMSPWLVAALCVIVAGGFTILLRLSLLRIALGFWASFAACIAVLAASGHAMTARWHLGPISGFHFWWVLVTSPEVLVFLFFMITDPKTAPRSPSGRLVYAVVLGVLSSALISLTTTEFASKVALLGALAIVCIALPLLRRLELPIDRRLALVAAPVAAAAFAAAVLASGNDVHATAFRAVPAGTLPPITILPSHGVQTQLDRRTAELIAHDFVTQTGFGTAQTLELRLAPGREQSPPYAVAVFGGKTYELDQAGNHWRLRGAEQAPQPAVGKLPVAPSPGPLRLRDVAAQVGLDFHQGAFRHGVVPDVRAMMGGGVCWLDVNGDGQLDLFAVNSYSGSDGGDGAPRTALFENRGGSFRDVSHAAHADLAVQGNGCVAGDLDGDGWTDLVVTTTSGVEVLWNDHGTFHPQRLPAVGWYAGAAIADVNGDGRPDLFVAGYADPNEPVPNSYSGFPTNIAGVRDLLFLNEADRHFRDVGVAAGLEASSFRHGLGAEFTDVNGDGRPDLYVANDEDPNELYVNVPWPGGVAADPDGLGFRLEERAVAEGVADPYAGMGIAVRDGGLFVTNSRNEASAVYRRDGARFVGDRPAFLPALGAGFAGWGVSWVDLTNSGRPDLVLAAGAIPVTSLRGDAEPLRVLGPKDDGTYGDLTRILGPKGIRVDGRGVAAADAGNDGRMEVAVNTIGGHLVLLRPSGPRGHWLDVRLTRFSPGAVVSVELPNGRRLVQEVHAGSSYLSSEDPRVHFGLGRFDHVLGLTVRFPFGGVTRLDGVTADQIVPVLAPPVAAARKPANVSATAPGCTPRLNGRSVAGAWNETAVTVLRASGLSEPVQARDLFDLSAVSLKAWRAEHGLAARQTAISYAAYRLLLWRLSFGANLQRTFAELTAELRALCGLPAFVGTAGASPGAVGNRLAAAAIAAGRADGSLESLHYADPGYVPPNPPLVVAQPGSGAHDPTFWQPLALSQVAVHGGGLVPESVQTFADPQWGRVRGVGRVPWARVPWVGLVESSRYQQAALAVIRATADAPARSGPDPSPLGWNEIAIRAQEGSTPAARLARDVRVSYELNAALTDAAIASWRGKRASQAPRPISMIRYLAFQGQSSDPSQASYAKDGLPLARGLVELRAGKVWVRRAGRWVLGSAWTALAETPPSPGGVSEDAAFAAAARAVLGPAVAGRAAVAARLGLAQGIDVPQAVDAGRRAGLAAARAARATR